MDLKELQIESIINNKEKNNRKEHEEKYAKSAKKTFENFAKKFSALRGKKETIKNTKKTL